MNETYHSGFYGAHDLLNQGPKLSGYALTNLFFKKDWQTMYFTAQVNNVFDRHYARFANFFSGPPSSVEFYPADGVNVLISLGVKVDG